MSALRDARLQQCLVVAVQCQRASRRGKMTSNSTNAKLPFMSMRRGKYCTRQSHNHAASERCATAARVSQLERAPSRAAADLREVSAHIGLGEAPASIADAAASTSGEFELGR